MMTDNSTGIVGLEWRATPSLQNGETSSVTPFPTTDLIHLVFHGERPFRHGHYGYHAGLEDRLTFLGPPEQVARGFFLDCRAGSSTLHKRVEFTFRPSSGRTLHIPCGVAHCFEGLENIYTLNCFAAFLPPPDLLLTDKSPWATGADIHNIPMQTPGDQLPVVTPNPYPASPRFNELLSVMQSETLGFSEYEYPYTEDVVLPDGTASTLMIRKRLSPEQRVTEWEPIPGIDGLGWRGHLVVWSSLEAGYAALTDPAPLQVIDHGVDHYATDAYGIHLAWEDRLTFVGPSTHEVRIKVIDCRRASPTYHEEISYEFSPSPLRFMVIPAGVAHAFESLEHVFTINRPRRCAGSADDYEPGNDVIDWPLDKRPAPSFDVKVRDFPFSYYRALTKMQRDYLSAAEAMPSTAAVLLVDDGCGKPVRVAIRKSADAASQ